jgi:4-hydroxy-tetrahydrodipicolinate synthase
MFKGSLTALITPFRDDTIDQDTFEKFVNWQISEGVHGIVPSGTTGESVTFTKDEFRTVVELCVRVSNKRVPVIVGSGTNCTRKTIELSQTAEKLGADALLVVSPYYNKPSQEGLYAHFKAVHDATNIPIILYDIPPRSVVEIDLDTLVQLAELPRIAGVKDATNKLGKPLQLRNKAGDDFCLLSGDDATTLAYLAQGGDGCISVIANIAPRLCAEMHTAWMNGDVKKAQSINKKLQPLSEAAFCQPSPAPVKYGAELLGFGSRETRLPITVATESTRQRIKGQLEALELL